MDLMRTFFLALNGMQYIKNLMRYYKDFCLVLCTWKGIGDVCIACAYFMQYNEKINKKTKLVICENGCAIAERFGISRENMILVPYKKIVCLDKVIHLTIFRHWINKWSEKKKILVTSPWYYSSYKLANIPGFSALDITKFGVYSGCNDWRPSYPHVKTESFINILSKPYIILNPFSNSNSVPAKIFEEISQRLQEKGYTVYTNLASKQKEIPGTLPLNVSIDELYLLSGEAECIISIRSGILDYIISNTKRIVSVYNDSFAYITPSFYSLEKWETGCEIFNHIYPNSVDIDEIVQEATGNAD